MWLWIVLLIIFCIYVYVDAKLPKNFPPVPGMLPLVGNIHVFFLYFMKYGSCRDMFDAFVKKCGPVMAIKTANFLQVVVNGKLAVEEVLANKKAGGRSKVLVHQYIRKTGEGLIFVDEQKVAERRRLCTKILKELGFGKSVMEKSIAEEALHFVSHLEERSKTVEGGRITMNNIFFTPVINTLWQIVTGFRFSYGDPFIERFIELFRVHDHAVYNSAFVLNAVPALRHVAPRFTGYESALELRDFFWDYMQKILEEYRKENKEKIGFQNFIEGLLEAREQNKDVHLSDEDINDITYDLFEAGVFTTSTTLSFAFLYMIVHPEVQRKVQEEIDRELGMDTLPSVSDMIRLPYTVATLLEVQRIRPAIWILPRLSVEDLEIMNYTIPKGTFIWLNIFSAHMDDEIWKDPGTFNPERFLQDGRVINENKLFGFGGGRRRCLGENVAKMSLFLFFVILLQRFTFSVPPSEAPPSTEPTEGALLRPKTFHALARRRS